MPISTGTRRIFGKRFAIDPALLLEAQRIEEQYRRAPELERMAINKEQFAETMAFNKEQAELNRESAEKGGMVGTAGNVALTGAMIRAMTMEKGDKFFGTWGAPATVTTAGRTGMGLSTVSPYAPTTAPTYALAPEITPFATKPALITGADLATEGATAGGAGYTGAAPMATETGMMAPYTAVAGEVALPAAAAGFVGGKLGQPIGETIGMGGKKERGAAGGALAGAAAGAAMTSWSGPGAIVGAAVGGVVGYASNKVICTELYRQRLLDREIYEAEQGYRKLITPTQYVGYRIMADPIVARMKKSKRFTLMLAPLIRMVARQMAHTVEPGIRGSRVGKIILPHIITLCWLVGKFRSQDRFCFIRKAV